MELILNSSHLWRLASYEGVSKIEEIMAKPGRSYRTGIPLLELTQRIPDEAAARKWSEAVHWPDGELSCLRCSSANVYRCRHKTMPFRCRD